VRAFGGSCRLLHSTVFDYGLPLSSDIMLRYAIIFVIVALIAEAFGVSGVAGEASWIAHVLLVVAVSFIVVSFVTGRRGPACGLKSPFTIWKVKSISYDASDVFRQADPRGEER
jgi:uncharacterized membrane protein YtjA (UPF0391 family)